MGPAVNLEDMKEIIKEDDKFNNENYECDKRIDGGDYYGPC